MNDGRLEADHRRLDYRNFTDDEEVTLLTHKRDTDVPDNPVSDVCDGPDSQIHNEKTLHGARPRRNERERPPVGVLDLEAAGGVGAGRWINMESRPSAVTRQTARLWLIRDRFIAGHSSCELRRHLDSVPSETWWIVAVSGRATLTRRSIELVNLVRIQFIRPMWWGTRDNISETTPVAVVTRPRSGPDQLEDLLRRLLMAVDTPAPISEVPAVEKLLQRLMAETQSHPPPVVSPPESVGLEKMLRSFLSGQQQTWPPSRQRPIRRDWNGVVCLSCGKSGHAATWCPTLDESFPFRVRRHCYMGSELARISRSSPRALERPRRHHTNQ